MGTEKQKPVPTRADKAYPKRVRELAEQYALRGDTEEVRRIIHAAYLCGFDRGRKSAYGTRKSRVEYKDSHASRVNSIKNGLHIYMGIVCRHCGGRKRYVSTGGCIVCASRRAVESTRIRRQKQKEAQEQANG